MTPDDDRMETKTTGAVVMDIAEIRARRDAQKNVLIAMRNPDTETVMNLFGIALIVCGLIFLSLYFKTRG